jgi:hypothetical protein
MRIHSLTPTLRVVALAALLAWSLLFLTTYCGAQDAAGGLAPGFTGAVSQIQEGNSLQQTGSNQSTALGTIFQGAGGIVTINQSAGNLNNQAILVWLGVSESATPPQVLGIALMHNNALVTTNAFYSVSIGSQAFQAGQGLVAINQVAGNMNNQLTTLGFSLGRQVAPNTPTNVGITTGAGSAIVAVSNAQLTQIVASQNNQVTNNGPLTAKAQVEDGAFQDFRGVVAATLIAGNLNQVVHHVAIQVAITP